MEIEQQNKMYYTEILGLRKHLEKFKNEVQKLETQNKSFQQQLIRSKQTISTQGKKISNFKKKNL